MGLFDIFKKKRIEIDLNDEITKLIAHGILFEEDAAFLYWNEPVAEIRKRINVTEKLFADRVVYHWGEHIILNGLKFNLTTIFWYNDPDSEGKRFRSIEFQTDNSDDTDLYSTQIKAHIGNNFKAGVNKEITDTSEYFEWLVGEVKLSLYTYEKYSVRKLKFEICKL